MPIILATAGFVGLSALSGWLATKEFSAAKARSETRAVRAREGDARLRALLSLCESNGLEEEVTEEIAKRMSIGRVGRILAHVVNDVKNLRGPVFSDDEAEFISTMRQVVREMERKGMRPSHITEWKYLVTVAVLTPTEHEVISMGALHGETRSHILEECAAIKAGPGVFDLLSGSCQLHEWWKGHWHQKPGQAMRSLHPEEAVPLSLNGRAPSSGRSLQPQRQ